MIPSVAAVDWPRALAAMIFRDPGFPIGGIGMSMDCLVPLPICAMKVEDDPECPDLAPEPRWPVVTIDFCPAVPARGVVLRSRQALT